MSFSKIFVILVFCWSSLGVFAQKFSLGIKAGVLGTYTNFPDAKDTLKTGVKFGYNFGGLISFPLKRNCAFVSEAGFSRQGRSYTYGPDQDKWTNTYNFIDLSMALRKHFHWNLIKHISTDWFFNVGPNINYWLSGTAKMTPYFGRQQHYTLAFDQTGQAFDKIYITNVNRWLYGINVGIGFSAVTLKNQKIVTELRMTWGQTYLGQRNSEYISGVAGILDEVSMKCNLKVLNFSVAYIFDRDIQKGRMGKSTKKIK